MDKLAVLHTCITIGMLLSIHWFADFFCQSHRMASLKSVSISWLTWHVVAYTVIFFWGIVLMSFPFNGLLILDPRKTLVFLGVNFVAHWFTDLITSKITKHYFDRENWHTFFVWIGFDQMIHHWTIILAYAYFLA